MINILQHWLHIILFCTAFLCTIYLLGGSATLNELGYLTTTQFLICTIIGFTTLYVTLYIIKTHVKKYKTF